MELTRSVVKAHIQDADRVYVSAGKPYVPEKADHRVIWPKLVAAIGTKGDPGETPNRMIEAMLVSEFSCFGSPLPTPKLTIAEATKAKVHEANTGLDPAAG